MDVERYCRHDKRQSLTNAEPLCLTRTQTVACAKVLAKKRNSMDNKAKSCILYLLSRSKKDLKKSPSIVLIQNYLTNQTHFLPQHYVFPQS
jgi:hypothetical protein